MKCTHRLGIGFAGCLTVLALLVPTGCDSGSFLGLADYPRDLLFSGLSAAILLNQPDGTGDGADAGVGQPLPGAEGPQGPKGPPGPPGAVGADGADGAQGADGATGPRGAQGPAGPAGADGAAGPAGAAGAAGASGGSGPAGANGATLFETFIDDFFSLVEGAYGTLGVDLVTISEPVLSSIQTSAIGYRVSIPDMYDAGNDVTMRLFLHRTGEIDGSCFIFTVDARRLRYGLDVEVYGDTRWVRLDTAPSVPAGGGSNVFLVVDLPINTVAGLGYPNDLADADALAFELATFTGDGGDYHILGAAFFESLAGTAATRNATVFSSIDEAVCPNDCVGNGIDCNANGESDDCDIETGFSEDCNLNGVPDECDLCPIDTATAAAVDQPVVVYPARPVVAAGVTNATTQNIAVGTTLPTVDLNSGLTPTDLVNTLIGVGVNVSNVSFVGANVAAGTFSGGAGIIGFADGIILSSGDVSLIAGPTNTVDDISGANALNGDADLDALIPGFETFDATVLEFDFQCDGTQTIQFQYVFASDEYNEFVGSEFNDVFAFFLNGQNIALVPGAGNTPVAINNVNCGNPFAAPGGGQNCNLFINNDCSDLFPSAELPFPCTNVETEMDGLTVVFTASGPLQPGVNHIKLAIADAGDLVLDSNVFIRAQSFACALPTGSCCNSADFTCRNDVLEADCQGLDETWNAGIACDLLDPPCLPTGACCDRQLFQCIDNVPQAECLGDWTEGVLCADLDPACSEVITCSQDCNINGIPDECELLNNDCNENGIPDDCDGGCEQP